MSTPTLALEEAAARRLLLVEALEAQPSALWSADDRAWATRLARQTLPAGADDAACLTERCRHVLQRLRTRDAALADAPESRGWRAGWLLLAALLGLAAGLLVDAVGSSQHINLLAPPVWGVIAWNLFVYAALLLPVRGPAGLRAGLARWLGERGLPGMNGPKGAQAAGGAPLAAWRLLWAQAALPLAAWRAAALFHVAALALALGLAGGLYLRGMVLDYRVGWQSTFLSAAQVQATLATLLAPASALTGIQVPGEATLQAQRLGPGTAPTASAAPWIHLYAAMLALAVVLPRSGLVLWALARASRLSRRLPLPADSVYLQRLLHELRGDAARVQLWPHGAAPTPDALAALRGVLRAALGDGLELSAAPAVPYGEEDAAPPAPAPRCTLGLLLADLSSTPEEDTHGRWLKALRVAAPGLPLLLVLDEAAFAARFATLPARVAERRKAWQGFADAAQLPLWGLNLARPDNAADAAALQAALQSRP